MSKKAIYISFPILLLFGIYFLGPTPATPKFEKTMPLVPQDANELERYVAKNESLHKLKPDNEARILWADSTKKRTEFSVVYLHGFSASQEEGDPVHESFAKKFGCNLYLARLADHGIDTTDQLINFTPDRWWQSSKEALAIGKALGDKVIIMSTSTGGTMALILAAEYPADVFALINLSPNISINDGNAWLLNNPWGLQIARKVIGGNSRSFPPDSVKDRYWNNPYRMEAVVQLEELLEASMTKATFEKVKCPSLSLYYYKNEQEQDPTVKVSSILEMNEQLGTPADKKVAIPIPNAGGHVIGSHLVSKDLETVKKEAEKFAVEKLGMALSTIVKRDGGDSENRVANLRDFIKEFGFVRLPFKFTFAGDSIESMLQKFDNEKSEKIKSKIGLGYSALYGILPDTSRYFYVLTGIAASVMILDVVTIDKKGQTLFRDSPMENNCMHYVEDDMYCNEYVILDEEFKINYYYKSKYVLNLVESQHDTICDFISKKGYFNESGKIIYQDRLVKRCS